MTTTRRFSTTLLGTLLAVPLWHGLCTSAFAEGTYPSQPITLVMPFAPGGITDNIARLLARELQADLGQTVLVDNRPGASGTLGAAAVARGPKDGYTALFTITTHVQMPALQRRLPYDAVKDFVPVSQIGISTSALVVSADFPANTLQELVAKLKAEPGKYAIGSTGTATTSHIVGELFKKEAGVEMAHVPYKGAAPMVADLLGGHIKVAVLDTGTALPHLNSGKIRALAAIGTQRGAKLPQVPTFQELGYSGFEPYAWIGMFLPSGTPPERVQKLSTAVVTAIRRPEVQQKMRDMNFEPVGSSAADFALVLKQDTETWKRVIDRVGVKLDD